jgi:hypothetical protein
MIKFWIMTSLVIVAIIAMGLGKVSYDEINSKLAKVTTEYVKLRVENIDLSAELYDFKKSYPLKHFSNLNDLKKFASSNIKPYKQYANDTYLDGLKIQEEAARQGYFISAVISRGNDFYSQNRDTYISYCMAIVTGYGTYKWNVDKADVTLFLSWGDLDSGYKR